MESTAKIQLSTEEAELVNNTKWILTKHIITKKVFQLFGDLNAILKRETESYKYLFPDNIKDQNGKITKGENYQLLPYVILDFPSFFSKNRIFAIRTMFWWGNFFSITLHLSGEHKKNYIRNIEEVFLFLQKNNFFICVNENEWHHHFEEDNYIPVSSLNMHQFKKINEKDFFKVSKKIPVTEWKKADEFLLNSFKEIIDLLQINFLNDKKDLLPGFPTTGSDL